MGKLFGTDGIRGQANRFPITSEVVLKLGKAIAMVLGENGSGKRRALIGKDTRLSGYMLESALTSGLVSMGMDVFLVGPLPTPAVAHLVKSMNATVGLMLTASHNPFDDNGIKIFDSDGFKLSDELEARIEHLLLQAELPSDGVRSQKIGKAMRIEDARGRYIEYAKGTIGNHSLAGLKAVVDCANGAAYQLGPWIFQELGAEVIKEAVSPDGLNINNGCGALHPEHIGGLVREHSADVGIAFDGDADRVIFCDSAGHCVDGDRILAMCAIAAKERGDLKGDTLVATEISNLGLRETMGRHGISVVTTAVGDRHVIDRMRHDGYNLGGEKSGHIIFMDYVSTGDGIISALQVLKLMKVSGKPLAELADCMVEFPQRMVSIRVRSKPPLDQLPKLGALIRECEADLQSSGRLLVRYSGTEPKLRVLVEARESQRVDHWIERFETVVRGEFGA